MNKEQDAILPTYYQMKIKDTTFDVFDLVRAIQNKREFSFELATALKYIVRLKLETPEKQINDLQKAIECINRQINELQKTQ